MTDTRKHYFKHTYTHRKVIKMINIYSCDIITLKGLGQDNTYLMYDYDQVVSRLNNKAANFFWKFYFLQNGPMKQMNRNMRLLKFYYKVFKNTYL